MHRITAAALLAAAVIHLLPLVGVLGGSRLEALYGITVSDAPTLLLLRHRAVLFGLLGTGLAIAAWRPAWHVPAALAALVSVVSFLAFARAEGALTPAIARVVLVDRVAAVLLVVGLAAALVAARRGAPGAR